MWESLGHQGVFEFSPAAADLEPCGGGRVVAGDSPAPQDVPLCTVFVNEQRAGATALHDSEDAHVLSGKNSLMANAADELGVNLPERRAI